LDPFEIFVSFCGRNQKVRDLVALMWLRLEEQPIDVYNYERPEFEIRPGSDIEVECKMALDRSRVCLVVVSEESFNSVWAKRELEYALSLPRKDHVFYIGLTKELDWPKPFAHLLKNKAFSLLGNINDIYVKDIEDIVESLVHRFCSEHRIPYLPPELDLTRLPLRRKIYQEIYSNSENSLTPRSLEIDLLFKKCRQFSESYAARKLLEAEKKIERIIEDSEELFPQADIYYPKLIRLVVVLEKELNMGCDFGVFKELNSEVNKLLEECRGSLDANIFGLLGNIALYSGRADDAYANFEEAHRRLTSPDPAIIHNLALSAVLSGNQDRLNNVYTMLKGHSNGSLVSSIGNIKRIQILESIVGCYQGRARQGIDSLSKMQNIEPRDYDIFRQFLDQAPEHARKTNDREASIRVLDLISRMLPLARKISNYEEVSFLQREAILALELGLNERAMLAIEKAVSVTEYRRSVSLLTHAALITHACGQNESAANYAKLALSESRYSSQPEQTSYNEYEYHRGLAAWLLKKDDIATDCFSRISKNPEFNWNARDYSWVSRRKLNRLSKFQSIFFRSKSL